MKTAFIKIIAILGVLAVVGACSSTRTQESAGEAIDDSVLTGKVKVGLIDDPITKAGQINVETYRGVVQLGGFVDNAQQKEQATKVGAGPRRRNVDGLGRVEVDGGFDDQGIPDQRGNAKGCGAADRVRRFDNHEDPGRRSCTLRGRRQGSSQRSRDQAEVTLRRSRARVARGASAQVHSVRPTQIGRS
jgi:BON domain